MEIKNPNLFGGAEAESRKPCLICAMRRGVSYSGKRRWLSKNSPTDHQGRETACTIVTCWDWELYKIFWIYYQLCGIM